ncbi:hypothetical protein FACS189437_04670 [Bacteroidia bacterium]|nr:hypothetical protein FACS189437_04670 [Bacteroidia bacterium]
MAIHADLKNLFPKYDMHYGRRVVSIWEKDANAKVNEVKWINSDFDYIDTEIVKDLTSFFRLSQSHEIFHKDCDGIIVLEENGKKYIFLSELKSSFDTSDLYSAMHQIISSYIKINMVLHLLINYRNSDYIFKAFIISLPPQRDYISTLHKQLMLPSSSQFKVDADFSAELYVHKKVKLKATECEKLKGLQLGSNCLFKDLEFYYIDVPHGQNSITLDALSYLQS